MTGLLQKALEKRMDAAAIADAMRALAHVCITQVRPGMYRKAVSDALADGKDVVYLPAGRSVDERLITGVLSGRTCVCETSAGNPDGEPCYSSLEAGSAGRNSDGSPHAGFLVIDVLNRMVVDVVEPDGKTRLSKPIFDVG